MKVLDDFKAHLIREKYAANTTRRYVDYTLLLLVWCRDHRGRKNLLDITSEDVTEFYDDRQAKGLSPHNLLIARAGHRKFFRWGGKRGHVSKTLGDGVPDKICTSTKDQYALTEDQLTQVLKVVDMNLPYTAASMIRILASTGMRLGEMLILKRDSFVVVGGRQVVFTVQGLKGRNQQSKVRRTIMMARNNKAFRRYLDWRDENVALLGGTEVAGGWLFPAVLLAGSEENNKEKGGHISQYHVHRGMRDLRHLMQIPWLTPHSFRRTWITSLKRRGWSDLAIQEMSGHRDLKTTAIYYKPTPEDLADMAEKYE